MIGIKYRKKFIPTYIQFSELIFQQVIEFSRTDSWHLFSYVQNHTYYFGGRLLTFGHGTHPPVINLSVYPETIYRQKLKFLFVLPGNGQLFG